MERYAEYRDSGVAWIGEIPVEWEVVPLGAFANFRKGLNITKADLVDDGLPVLSYGQIHSKAHKMAGIEAELIRHVPQDCPALTRAAHAGEGSLVMADTSEDVEGSGNCAYVDRPDGIYAGYHTLIIDPASSIRGPYLGYLAMTDEWRSQIRSRVSGVKLYSVTQGILKACSLLVPPLDEQRAIAAWLDEKTGEIDGLVADTERSIELLEEYRCSVISEAVTKGLDSSVPMKDSGVEWIGEIPESWRVLRGKLIFSEVDQRSEDGSEELLTVSHLTGVTPRSQKNVNMFMAESLEGYKKCARDDIAANTMWLWQGAIGVSPCDGVISPSYNVYRQRSDFYLSEYLDHLLRTPRLVETYRALSSGITKSRLRLYPEGFLSIRFPVPPLNEQLAICGGIHDKVAAIDALIADKQAYVERLREYRKSLISEAVTGKFKVPGI